MCTTYLQRAYLFNGCCRLHVTHRLSVPSLQASGDFWDIELCNDKAHRIHPTGSWSATNMTGRRCKDVIFALRLEVHMCISKVYTCIQFCTPPCRNTYIKSVQLLTTAQAASHGLSSSTRTCRRPRKPALGSSSPSPREMALSICL